jgi:OmpA-OmpF porin, OOP family
MTKTKILCSLLFSATLAFAAKPYNYEITPLIGYNITEGNLHLKDSTVFGGEFQVNNLNSLIAPELSVLYTNTKFTPMSGSTNIYRIALNGVYEYPHVKSLIPFAKAGLGYETMSRHLQATTGNRDSMFGDIGGGIKVPLLKNIALKLEAVYMLKNNANRWDNNLALLAGVSIAFGQAVSQPVETTPIAPEKPTPVAPPVKKVAPTPVPAPAPKPKDDDHDGVINALDKCPNTPAGVKVDANGCMKKVNLHINFAFDSYKIKAPFQSNIQKFSAFLKSIPMYNVKIIGYTDSRGSNTYNLKLSLHRAKAVKSALEKTGIDAKRIQAVGKGEADPIATNTTAAGRAQNRRIEAQLIRQ